MPKQIRVMGVFELLYGGYFLSAFMVALVSGSSGLSDGALYAWLIYFFLQVCLGLLLLANWRFAAPIELVASLLRMGSGPLMFVYGLWVLYVFIASREVRGYVGIPEASTP